MENNQNKKIASGIFWKTCERIGSQGVSFFVSLILARILMPEDYGAVAVVTIFIEIANVLLTSGLNTALIQKKEITEEETSTIFYCSLIIGVVLYGVMYAAAPLIAYVYELPILVAVTRVFAIRLPISAIQAIQSAIISRNMDFKKSFFSTLGGTIASAIVGIVMAVKGYGVWAMVAQYLTSTIADTLIMTVTVRWFPKKMFSLKAARPLISYGWKVMVTDLIGTVFNYLNSMIIGVQYSSTDLAYYSKGIQVPQLIRNNIFTVMVGVLFPAMAKVADKLEELKNVSRKSVSLLAYAIIPMMVGIIAVSEELVIVLFTEKWIAIVPFLCIACIECIGSILPRITILTLRAAGYSDITLKMEFVKKPILVVSTLVAMKFGVTAIALVLPLNTLIETILNGYYCQKKIGYSLWEQLKDVLPPLLLSVAMGIVVWLLHLLALPLLLKLVVQIAAGVAVYVLLSAVFKVESFTWMIGFVKKKLGKA